MGDASLFRNLPRRFRIARAECHPHVADGCPVSLGSWLQEEVERVAGADCASLGLNGDSGGAKKYSPGEADFSAGTGLFPPLGTCYLVRVSPLEMWFSRSVQCGPD